jgi:formiminoglutamase
MSGPTSSPAAWFSRLRPTPRPVEPSPRADDPRLAEVAAFWSDGEPEVKAGQPVLIGFPQDEGVRRNRGRPGAAEAPGEIRRWLYRMTPCDGDADLSLLDLGDVRIDGDLEASQDSLATVLDVLLRRGAVPIVLGGGHETAYGHYLGYVRAGLRVAILNLDAHLDVRPCLEGRGHSGSPFRQALEHPTHPLPGDRYVCLGAQSFAVSREHADYVRRGGGKIGWRSEVRGRLGQAFDQERQRLTLDGPLYLTLDVDVVQAADAPAVSAPNPNGLCGAELLDCVQLAGASPGVASLDVVEVVPQLDRDGQTARWAALAVWHFLAGLARRA